MSMMVQIITAGLALCAGADQTVYREEYLFPPEPYHNHSSSLVETLQGDLLACWFHRHGERSDDTLVISGARKHKDAAGWSPPFVMADSQDLPDQNPVLFIDPRGPLWLFWISSLDNLVRSYLLQYRTSTHYEGDGAPAWDWQDSIICRPIELEKEFAAALEKRGRKQDATDSVPDKSVGPESPRQMVSQKLFQRLGWMTRQPPIMLSDSRMMLGLYSDVYDCSLMAFTEDWGKSWQFSKPMFLSGPRNIQPSLVLKKDGGIAAFMRAPLHIKRADSADGGMTWTETPMAIPNPGSSVACIGLKDGHWLLICNDAVTGRNNLTVYLSDDEGATWKWKRPLERLEGKGSASYPTVIQARDGMIHCSYSYKNPAEFQGSTIKHVCFNEAWVREYNGHNVQNEASR